MGGKKVLIIGGAGYVGSAACAWLTDRGYDVWILDDLSTGHRELVLSKNFVKARAGDRETVLPLLKREKFDGVMHFAAKSLVGESVKYPEIYRENNVEQTCALLEMMLEAGTKRLIFSSTCAIFGDPAGKPIDETLQKKPINPYGETKLEAERMLENLAARGLQSIALRYFNAAGAEEKLRAGEWHVNETHLIPRILRSIATGVPVEIYGDDYMTPDGSCVRDYVHVSDLAAAHGAALERLFRLPEGEGKFEAFNLGSETGYSVLEVIDACRRSLGKTVHTTVRPRRPGDPPVLIARSDLAKEKLGFECKHSLDSIIQSAWDWSEKLRKGIGKAVFLDRDGTINEDPGYLSDPSLVKLLPGVGEALAKLRSAGFLLIVVTNQSGVARGLIPAEKLPAVNAKINDLLSRSGVRIDHYECCLHHPDENCDCRKPKPKLIIDGARALGVDISRSYMIGDRDSDMKAGIGAGCKANIFLRTPLSPDPNPSAQFSATNLIEAVDWILSTD